MVDSQKPFSENESRLSRWSRLKRGATIEKDAHSKSNVIDSIARDSGAIEVNADSDFIDTKSAELQAPINPSSRDANATQPIALPSLDDVALDRDFTPFMQAKIPETLKRQALKALFKDAHFNTMDGLDIYIGDYTQFEPISPEEMAGLSAWKSIMKPLEQVVTPGGYAVDVESEEGKAVLAAREALKNESHEAADLRRGAAGSEQDANCATDDVAAHRSPPHERYGKRVSDFNPDEEQLRLEEAAPGQPPMPSSAALIADDPR